MNKKGQVLVIFVLLLPVLMIFIYYIGNKLYINSEKNNQTKIISLLCNYYKKEKDLDKIKNLGLKNDKNQEISINEQDDTIKITLVKTYKNVFNKNNKIKTILKCE